MEKPEKRGESSKQPAGGADPAQVSQKSHGVLYVGVDLGTSRTSVSGSNGMRETTASVVGYPKDVVSMKLLGRETIVGDEALERRLSLNLFRPLEHGVLRASENGSVDADRKAATDLLQHAISLVHPRQDEAVYAVIGVPAQASIHSKKALLEAARGCVDSVMLCSEPFAVAYGLDWLEDVLVIDIGAGTTDLCRMHGTMPEDADQVTLSFAGDFIDDELEAAIRQAHPEAQFTRNMVKSFKEKFASVSETGDRAVVEFPVKGRPQEFDLTDILATCCRKIVPPIVEALGELVASFDPEFQHKIRNRVLLAGGSSQIRGLEHAIEEEMKHKLGGGRVIRIEEPMYGGANGALKIAHDMPAEYWEKLK